jgi:RNA polymerase sigma-70 factor (ECF subfamily)
MQNETTADISLIEAIKHGDLSAFDEIVSRYSQRVHNLAFRISRNELDAQEIVQDVFVTVFFKIKKFEGKSAFSSWLYRVTANTALMKLRKNKQKVTSSLDEAIDQGLLQVLPANEDASFGCERSEIQEALGKALSAIPQEYQSVFVLRDVDKLSNEEVSDILGVSVPAIKSRLHRARLMLRKRLAEFFTEFSGRTVEIDEEELTPLVISKKAA